MNKADKICVVLIIAASILVYLPLFITDRINEGKAKEAVVRYRDQEILKIDLKQDKVYRVKGTLGDVEIEVKDEAIRVEKEASPYHYCSRQGWVKDASRPIICLPNDIVVDIEVKDGASSTDDAVIR